MQNPQPMLFPVYVANIKSKHELLSSTDKARRAWIKNVMIAS